MCLGQVRLWGDDSDSDPEVLESYSAQKERTYALAPAISTASSDSPVYLNCPFWCEILLVQVEHSHHCSSVQSFSWKLPRQESVCLISTARVKSDQGTALPSLGLCRIASWGPCGSPPAVYQTHWCSSTLPCCSQASSDWAHGLVWMGPVTRERLASLAQLWHSQYQPAAEYDPWQFPRLPCSKLSCFLSASCSGTASWSCRCLHQWCSSTRYYSSQVYVSWGRFDFVGSSWLSLLDN